MIRSFLRSIVVNSLALFIASRINSQLIVIPSDLKSLLFIGFIFVIVNILVRPIINLLLLPIHLVTLGTFRWITNLLILYIITRFTPNFAINPFLSNRLDLGFIIIPPVYFSVLGSYFLASCILSLMFHLLYWLFEV